VDPARYNQDWDAGAVANRTTEYATVVRTVGRAQPDLVIEAPGANGMLWSACIFVRSQRSLTDEFNAGAGQRFFIHPEATLGDAMANLQRLKPMAWVPFRSWSGAFIENLPGPAVCSDFYARVNLQGEQSWDFDVKQRRVMKDDESLWLLISGAFVCQTGGEDNPVVQTVFARTLIHDD